MQGLLTSRAQKLRPYLVLYAKLICLQRFWYEADAGSASAGSAFRVYICGSQYLVVLRHDSQDNAITGNTNNLLEENVRNGQSNSLPHIHNGLHFAVDILRDGNVSFTADGFP